MDPILEAVLTTPAEGEDQLVATLKSEGVDEKAIAARVAQHRLATGYADVLGEPDLKMAGDYRKKLKGMIDKARKGAMKEDEMKSMAEMLEEMLEEKSGDNKSAPAPTAKSDNVEAIVAAVVQQMTPVLKSKDEQIEQLAATVGELVQSHRQDVFTAKAQGYRHVPAGKDELAQVLKSAHDADPKLGETVETLLKRVNEAMSSSSIFKSTGSTGLVPSDGGDAMSRINALAQQLIQKSEKPLSEAKARAMVLKTAEGARLYDEYLMENPAQRAKTRDEYR